MKNIILIGIILGFLSCKSQDSIYEEYLVPNGLIYAAKAMNVKAFSGKDRILISWQNGSDPKVERARISWSNDAQWVDVDLNEDMKIVSKEIELEENTYSFKIRTYDTDGNISIPVVVTGTVYGDKYESSLVNRIIKSSTFNGDLTLEWFGVDETEVGIELAYTDIEGEKNIFIDRSETVSLIPNFDYNKSLSYKTVYKPDSMAIDLFYAPEIEVTIDPVSFILKNTWREINPRLPGDVAEVNASNALPGIWNGVTADNGFHTVTTGACPVRFSWDLGVNIARMNRFTFWPRLDGANTDVYGRGHPRVFELWGATTPNPDGSFNGWTLLGKFQSLKPSDGPVTPEEIADARAFGWSFDFVEDNIEPTANPQPAEPFRYIRMYVLENYNDGNALPVALGEISFWGTLTK